MGPHEVYWGEGQRAGSECSIHKQNVSGETPPSVMVEEGSQGDEEKHDSVDRLCYLGGMFSTEVGADAAVIARVRCQ